MRELKSKILFVCVFVLLLGAPVALGDWNLGDPHKMHYPQLPDPFGWDVCVVCQWITDDFMCSETGPVTDIHFWTSWYMDDDGQVDPSAWDISIWSDEPGEPNTLLWQWNGQGNVTTRLYGTGQEGWVCPSPPPLIVPNDHFNYYQVNITNIPMQAEPFIQQRGTIYWLVIRANIPPLPSVGWKTSVNDPPGPLWGNPALWSTDLHNWAPVDTDITGGTDPELHDMAFVITGVEKDPKNKRLKWSQPPIEWDPTWDIPVYCGWDELSWRDWIQYPWFDCWNCRTQCYGDADCDGYVDNDDFVILVAATPSVWPNPPYNPCADFNRDLMVGLLDLLILQANWLSYPPANCPLRPQTWQMAADDFRCLGSMPATSVHWWGSHQGWEVPGTVPPELPMAWRIGFWSNISATQSCDFLYGAATGQPMGNAPSSLYKIDPSTGVATLIGPIGFNGVTGLSFAPDGTLYGSCRSPAMGDALLITIDKMTGAGTAVGRINTGGTGQWAVPDISFRSDGVLYGIGIQPYDLITIDTATGLGTSVGPTGYVMGGNGLDFAPAPGGTLYATPSDNQSLVIINPATGAGSDVAGTVGNVPSRINALEFCESTGVLYGSWNDSVSGNRFLVTIDLTTGMATVVGQTVQGLDAITFNTFSHPDKLLWQIEVPEDRVDVNEVGSDEYPEIPYYDICYQYYLDLEPNEYFWQNHYETMDDIYWLSIAAVYDPCEDVPQYPWGWKTRPWSWMDDAVRFWMDENPEPGMVLDPERNMIEPIEEPIFGESFDLAFELDTDPNYIKWEQPFTGIRDWPHYEDEKSMATVSPITKYVQPPDLSPNGVDVDATTQDDPWWSAQVLADDFNCTTTEPITDIHIWGSWYGDYPFPNDVDFRLSIWSDRPVGPSGWSEPNEEQWGRWFEADNVTVIRDLDEGYYVPCKPYYEASADTICYRYDFYIDPFDAFMQEGDPCNPVVYWLVVEAYPWEIGMDEPIRFGWKTTDPCNHFKDDAVWTDDWGGTWNELRYPVDHPFAGESIDLAFEITGEGETEFQIDRFVADDWPCDNNAPVTAAAWWGSYIDYNYAACDITGPWMDLPVPPKYFWLTIWDDVPAGYAKWTQLPDPNGWDVCVVCQWIADDFNCTETGPVTDIHFWTSWLEDDVGNVNPSAWDISIWSDEPGEPSTLLWSWNGQGNVTTRHYGTGDEGWICPSPPPLIVPNDHQDYYQVNITNIPNPFMQVAGNTYWLVIKAQIPPLPSVGWKTSVNDPPGPLWGNPALWSQDLLDWQVVDTGAVDPELHDMAFEITTGEYSHPNNIIWEYMAYDYDEVLFGYDKHPEDPTGQGREPVFRYSVQLPEEDWFCQKEPNEVYWFGVVAVYDHPNAPNYDWGWTNHEHMYNDDAVAGYPNEPTQPGIAWWEELYDQTEVNSVDMSFILFTEPICFPATDPAYQNWVDVGRPGSWCCKYQNQGDCNGDGWVNLFDLWVFKPAYNSQHGGAGAYDADADFNHDKFVNLFDLWIFKPNYNSLLGPGYDCPYNGPYQPPCP